MKPLVLFLSLTHTISSAGSSLNFSANAPARFSKTIVGIIAKVVPESMTPMIGFSVSGSYNTVLPYANPLTLTPHISLGFHLPLMISIEAKPSSPPTIYVALIPPKIA